MILYQRLNTTNLIRAHLGNVLAQQLIAAHQLLRHIVLDLSLDGVHLAADGRHHIPIEVLQEHGGQSFGQLTAHDLGDGLHELIVELTVLLVAGSGKIAF